MISRWISRGRVMRLGVVVVVAMLIEKRKLVDKLELEAAKRRDVVTKKEMI